VRTPYATGPTAAALLIACLCCPSLSAAQTYTASADLLFYGDNTEFVNPFREGDTVLGVSGRIALDVSLNDHVTLRVGFFGNGRFGAHEGLEHAEPAVALEVARGRSRFIFGSLETVQTRHDVPGPDRETLHGLLPPLQEETLTFARGQEMGLQWLVASARGEHDTWINWQRLNTAEHRERFDAGYRGRVALAASVGLLGQWHLVHEGGQRFASGAVSDSQGGSVGVDWQRSAGGTRWTIDTHVVATRDVPDRERPALTEGGMGGFVRAAGERGPWRAHAIAWRSRDTLKAEGDANYLARRRDGIVGHKVRDYAELGLTRHFRPAAGVHLFAAVRLHRIESHYEYSYRIVGRVRVRAPLGTP
jgi:hypothetical protein